MNGEGTYQDLSLDIVVPVYNEGEVILQFHQQLNRALKDLPYRKKVYYINDGSSDHTTEVLTRIAEYDERVVVVELSRNFGHQAALSAGLDLVDGDIVITMDGDGQHPTDLIPDLIALYKAGYDVVQTQRLDDPKLSFIKRTTSTIFYLLINKIGNININPGTADFRLMSNRVVCSLRRMQEYHRFFRGLIPWMGYHTVILPYVPQERLAGKSKYTFRKMMKLAMDAIFSFSLAPLQVGFFIGFLLYAIMLTELIYVLTFWFQGRQGELVPGWSSIVFLILLTGGSQMIVVGLIGIYVGYIYQEVKRRPVYIIREIYSHQDNHRGSRIRENS